MEKQKYRIDVFQIFVANFFEIFRTRFVSVGQDNFARMTNGGNGKSGQAGKQNNDKKIVFKLKKILLFENEWI